MKYMYITSKKKKKTQTLCSRVSLLFLPGTNQCPHHLLVLHIELFHIVVLLSLAFGLTKGFLYGWNQTIAQNQHNYQTVWNSTLYIALLCCEVLIVALLYFFLFCFSRSYFSTPSCILCITILKKILLGTDKSVIPV